MIKINENPRNNFNRQMDELCKTLYNNFVARTNSLYYSNTDIQHTEQRKSRNYTHLILI